MKKKKNVDQIIRGLVNRFLHFFARHCYPSNVRVVLHRMRGVKIGKNVLIGLDVLIDDDGPERVTIEDDAVVTACCILLTHQRDLTKYHRGGSIDALPFREEPILIKRGARIGVGSIILPGVTVGIGAVVGAGSVVTKDVPDYCVAVGVPAKVIKSFDDRF